MYYYLFILFITISNGLLLITGYDQKSVIKLMDNFTDFVPKSLFIHGVN